MSGLWAPCAGHSQTWSEHRVCGGRGRQGPRRHLCWGRGSGALSQCGSSRQDQGGHTRQHPQLPPCHQGRGGDSVGTQPILTLMCSGMKGGGLERSQLGKKGCEGSQTEVDTQDVVGWGRCSSNGAGPPREPLLALSSAPLAPALTPTLQLRAPSSSWHPPVLLHSGAEHSPSHKGLPCTGDP